MDVKSRRVFTMPFNSVLSMDASSLNETSLLRSARSSIIWTTINYQTAPNSNSFSLDAPLTHLLWLCRSLLFKRIIKMQTNAAEVWCSLVISTCTWASNNTIQSKKKKDSAYYQLNKLWFHSFYWAAHKNAAQTSFIWRYISR